MAKPLPQLVAVLLLVAAVDALIVKNDFIAQHEGPLSLAGGAALPGLAKAGISTLQFTLEPCQSLTPHVHPHSELQFVVSGRVYAGLVDNNGTFGAAILRASFLDPSTFLSIPAGQIHFIQNESCEPATVVSFFDVPAPDLYFLPAAEAAFPSWTLASAYGLELPLEANQLKRKIKAAPVPFASLGELCSTKCGTA